LYLPRDLYNTDARVRVQEVLREYYNAVSVDFDVLLSESALARIHFVARVARDSALPRIRAEQVEQRIVGAVRSWSEDVHAFLTPSELGDAGASNARADLWSKAFPPSYEEHHTPAEAVADVGRFEDLDAGRAAASNARADLWSTAVPPSYEEHPTPAEAVADVGRFEDLDAGRGSAVRLYRPERLTDASVRLVLYRHERVGLSEVLPFLT